MYVRFGMKIDALHFARLSDEVLEIEEVTMSE